MRSSPMVPCRRAGSGGLDFAQCFVLGPDSFSDEYMAKMRSMFSEAELVELGSFCLFVLGFATMVHAFDLKHGELHIEMPVR